MPKVLSVVYKEDIEKMTCANPQCDHTSHDSEMWFHSMCHINMPTWVKFVGGETPVVQIICAACGNPIIAVAVASYEMLGAVQALRGGNNNVG